MRWRALGTKLSVVTVGMFAVSVVAFAWVYGVLIFDTLHASPDDREMLSKVGLFASLFFCLALAKFIVIDWDGNYE